jgi:hypothetical protein
MLQTVQGVKLYIVDFDVMPELPITGIGEEAVYAEALTVAIQNGDIVEPGKYGIQVDIETKTYNIFKIVE